MADYTYQCNSLADLPAVAAQIIPLLSQKIVAFHASMGLGKTTLIKELCKQLGVEEEVTSPTFAIVNEYADAGKKPVYHFDFYRISKISEAFDLGYENYFFSGYYCFIEWPEKIEELLNFPHIKIFIRTDDDEKRIITLHA